MSDALRPPPSLGGSPVSYQSDRPNAADDESPMPTPDEDESNLASPQNQTHEDLDGEPLAPEDMGEGLVPRVLMLGEKKISFGPRGSTRWWNYLVLVSARGLEKEDFVADGAWIVTSVILRRGEDLIWQTRGIKNECLG